MTVERLSKKWNSSIYAFFEPRHTIHEADNRRWVEFACGARHCKATSRIVKRFLDTKDSSSTSNLRKHAIGCWGKELLQEAEAAATVELAREGLAKAEMRDGRLTTVFERQGKGPVTFSTMPLTYKETRVNCVKWCAESMRPTQIVDDAGFHMLMKTGRPHYRLPSARTVRRDTHVVFKAAKDRIVQLLQASEHDVVDDLVYLLGDRTTTAS
ncbi:hypothetical protein BKA70DRAFT_1132220 [Coprinopsis sp. MPI-PUGE-AT-0042]|nr:hypothetical protein BKA70DRAFT_1132220 [Coprinopsis sp. MPI-PUGE-AT-0042]